MTNVQVVDGLKCYICAWSATQCQDYNCYNNPDVCSNNNFSPAVVQPTECPAGCENFVITDPNGEKEGKERKDEEEKERKRERKRVSQLTANVGL